MESHVGRETNRRNDWTTFNVDRYFTKFDCCISLCFRATLSSVIFARAMVLKAMFLDFDDTLCMTSEHDVPAFEAATAAAAATFAERRGDTAGPVDRERLRVEYRAFMSATPWDTSPTPMEVTAFRSAMWSRAVALQVDGSGEGDEDINAAGTAAQAAFDSHRLANLVFLPEALDALKHARQRGLKTVMITNGHHKVQRDKLGAVMAHEQFPEPETIIVGGEEVLKGEHEKPHVSIFKKACAVARCEPHEAIHVGDSLSTDVQVREGG